VSGSPAPHGRVLLVALTPESRAALGAAQAEIERFPYRVGRESRGTQRTADGFVRERRSPGSRPTNDLYLVEPDEPMNVSRAHFLIDRAGASYVVVDRESTCGTIVEGEIVGGGTRGGTIALHDGDVIIVGTSNSPYAFKFRVG
jgi:pSer/pThr/pTyr-binding forkhead associated (FHA) protein